MTADDRLSGEGSRPRETRRTVTILFADLVGSTALGERNRNPEDGHHGVANELLHNTAVSFDDLPEGAEVPFLNSPQRFRVERP